EVDALVDVPVDRFEPLHRVLGAKIGGERRCTAADDRMLDLVPAGIERAVADAQRDASEHVGASVEHTGADLNLSLAEDRRKDRWSRVGVGRGLERGARRWCRLLLREQRLERARGAEYRLGL